MKWALAELNKYRNTQLTFKEVLNLEKTLKSRDNSIIAVEPILVDGYIQVDLSVYVVHFTIKTALVLPSTRSLEPVRVPFELTVDEEYMTKTQLDSLVDISEEDKQLIMPLEKDLIDLNEAVEDYILLNLPLQVFTDSEKSTSDLPKGEFWQVLSEDDLEDKDVLTSEIKMDPRLAKLSELLEDKE